MSSITSHIPLALGTAVLLASFASPVVADDTLLGCIAGVEPSILHVKAGWGEMLRFDTSEFTNPDGHVLANDECYQFSVARTEDGRLLLRTLERMTEDASQGAEEDEPKSRN